MPRASAVALILVAAAAARPSEPAFVPVAPPPPDTLRDTLKQLKTRRAALDRLAGPHEPFDLTYLRENQTVLALRPNVIFAHPDLAEAAPWLHGVGTTAVRFLGGAPAGPGLDGLDQLLICARLSITPKPDTGDGNNAMFGATGGAFVARAARPCDWAAAVRTWFPDSLVRVHRGYGYRVVRINLGNVIPGLPVEPADAALFPAPDGRTLVADDVVGVTALIDRLADRRDPLPPPPGWDRVATAAVAVAVENRDKQWLLSLTSSRGGPEVRGTVDRLFLAADHLAAGLDLGPTTRVRVAALARNQFQAKHIHQSARVLKRRLADWATDTPAADLTADADLIAALRDGGTVVPTPLGVVYELEVKRDVVGLAVRVMKDKSPLPSGSAAAALPGFLAPAAPPAVPDRFPPPTTVVPAAVDIPRTRSPVPGDQGIPGYQIGRAHV